MAREATEKETGEEPGKGKRKPPSNGEAVHNDPDEEETNNSDEEEEEDEEPRLKYASLTKHLKPVYRNGDATSAFLVAGDKMVSNMYSTCKRSKGNSFPRS